MGTMLMIVGAILLALSIWSGINLGLDLLFDRIQYWGMFPKKRKS